MSTPLPPTSATAGLPPVVPAPAAGEPAGASRPPATPVPAAASGAPTPSAAPAAPVAPTAPTAPVTPAAPVAGPAVVAAPVPVVPAAPAAPAVRLSPEAQQAMRLEAFQQVVAALVNRIQGPQATEAGQWPAGGVSPALRALVAQLVQQATAHLGQPTQASAIQSWPATLVQAVLQQAAAAEAALVQRPTAPLPPAAPGAAPLPTEAAAAPRSGGPAVPPLQNWLVQQGTLQTPEGSRGFALTLKVPVAWAQAQALAEAAPLPSPAGPAALLRPGGPAAALPGVAPGLPLSLAPGLPAGTPLAPLVLPFQGALQTLESGALALVLQAQGRNNEVLRTSALLLLELQPLPAGQAQQAAAALYLPGALPEALQSLQTRNDPWLHMAALQASGQQPRDLRQNEHRSHLCQTADCQYAGRAPCAQPFCVEMNRIWASQRAGRSR